VCIKKLLKLITSIFFERVQPNPPQVDKLNQIIKLAVETINISIKAKAAKAEDLNQTSSSANKLKKQQGEEKLEQIKKKQQQND